MSDLVTTRFWRLALERAVKTIAQTAVALLGADAFDVLNVGSWKEVGVAAMFAGVLSILTSVASARVGDPEDPSLI